MSDASNVANSVRERLGGTSEDRLGKALSELLESPLLTGAIGRMFDAREKAAHAQEAAMGALNLPSAADIERLTRRLRSVSYRLEGIEDGVGRLDRALTLAGVEARLEAIEERLEALTRKIDQAAAGKPPASVTPAGADQGAARPRRASGVGGASGSKAGRRKAKPAASAKGPRKAA
jgi:hypothetical protein